MTKQQPLGPPALALFIGLVSGTLAYFINMPLPWMLGSMIGTTIAALFGVTIAAPMRLRPIVIPIIGVMIGSAITAEIWQQIGQWAGTLMILPIVLFASGGVSFLIYRKIGGYDSTTAFFSSMPGGLNEMLLMGGEAGGDERKIALAHAARILLVIFMVALFFGIFMGVRSGSNGAAWIAVTEPSLVDYALLIGCIIIGVPIGKRLNLPAAMMFGPMILSGLAHLFGWITIAPPTIFIIAAQVVMGAIIGCRFVGAKLRDIAHDLGLAAIASFLMLIVAGLLSLITAWSIGIPLSQTFLAFAPGGLTEMSLLTLAIGQDVAFVSIVHLIRITLVIGVAPAIFGVFSKR